MSDTDDKPRCPHCGQELASDWGESDEEQTPVDARQERVEQTNEILRQAALKSLEHAFNESQREVSRLQNQLDIAAAERSKLKTENGRLKLALRNLIKKEEK